MNLCVDGKTVVKIVECEEILVGMLPKVSQKKRRANPPELTPLNI